MNFKIYYLRRRVYRIGLLITGVLAVLIAIISFYGQNVGNFVVSVDGTASKRGIALSRDSSFLNPTSRLLANPVTDAGDMTYDWINWDEVINTDGNYEDPNHKYVAFTFYLMNVGEEAINLNLNINIEEVTKSLDDVIAIGLVTNLETKEIFMKKNTGKWQGLDHEIPSEIKNATNFLDGKTIVTKPISSFKPEQVIKYSIVLWLEGYDPEHNEKIEEGKIKLSMTFNVYTEEEK